MGLAKRQGVIIDEKARRVNYFLDVDSVFSGHGHDAVTGHPGQSGLRA
jgi:hypothetical protein